MTATTGSQCSSPHLAADLALLGALDRVSEVPYTGLSSQLSKFLQHMQQEQIVQVKELSKGVESIVAVDWRHPR